MSKKPCNNTIQLAAAGSGKTTYIVEDAVRQRDKRILVTTYTNENLDQIRATFYRRYGCIPEHITLCSWLSFLVAHGVRPYQNLVTSRRGKGVNFGSGPNRFVKASNADSYFLDSKDDIYASNLAAYVMTCNKNSGGAVVDRLQGIFDQIYIDEVQDLNGHELDFLQELFHSEIRLVLVGDPRQYVYSTNKSTKNRLYRGPKIVNWFRKMESQGLCVVNEVCECNRSNQVICDFADALFPDLLKTISKNSAVTGHDGVFAICMDQLSDYVARFDPTVLRDKVTSNTAGLSARNFGVVKGSTFDRVLIFPTAPIRNYLMSGDRESLTEGTRAKLYVAVTRARHSAAFVIDTRKEIVIPRFSINRQHVD